MQAATGKSLGGVYQSSAGILPAVREGVSPVAYAAGETPSDSRRDARRYLADCSFGNGAVLM